jgi:LuxR family maltose regulon positive regulatory protein
VLATREAPALPLARLRARDLVTELRGRDLCFTHEEAAMFFTQTAGLHLTADEVSVLEARTEDRRAAVGGALAARTG